MVLHIRLFWFVCLNDLLDAVNRFWWRCDKLRYRFGPMLPREQNYVSVKHLIGGSDLVETDNVFK